MAGFAQSQYPFVIYLLEDLWKIQDYNCLTLRRAPVLSDWNRFKLYALRVRRLNVSY